MITEKQSRLLAFIAGFIVNAGYGPSFGEMAKAIGAGSRGEIFRILAGLEERGFIRRVPHRVRAIEVLRQPPGQAEPGSDGVEGLRVAARAGADLFQAYADEHRRAGKLEKAQRNQAAADALRAAVQAS